MTAQPERCSCDNERTCQYCMERQTKADNFAGWPEDVCICGHERSGHNDDEAWRNSTICLCYCFRLNPNAIAHGHNVETPKLTQSQVGTAEGERLLDEDEIGIEFGPPTCHKWSFGVWLDGYAGVYKDYTYRTRLSRSALRAARGLPAETCDVCEKATCVCGHEAYPSKRAFVRVPETTLSGGVESSPDATQESVRDSLNLPSTAGVAPGPLLLWTESMS